MSIFLFVFVSLAIALIEAYCIYKCMRAIRKHLGLPYEMFAWRKDASAGEAGAEEMLASGEVKLIETPKE